MISDGDGFCYLICSINFLLSGTLDVSIMKIYNFFDNSPVSKLVYNF